MAGVVRSEGCLRYQVRVYGRLGEEGGAAAFQFADHAIRYADVCNGPDDRSQNSRQWLVHDGDDPERGYLDWDGVDHRDACSGNYAGPDAAHV